MSTAPWTSTILQNPQTPAIFSVITTSNLPSLPYCNSQFQKRSVNLAVKPLNFSFKPQYDNFSQEDYDEEPAIGDCIVYEEGVFNDPYLENTRNLRHSDARTTKTKSIKDADISPENLIPEEWLDVQKDLNITKKERRKMAQELEYGRTVEKRRVALLPLNSEEFEKAKQEQRKRASMPLDSEQFEKLKQEKMKQLSPVVLDNPKKAYFRVNEKRDEDTSGVFGGGRVAPRNPRLAVYGGGLEDVSAVFSSGKYDRGASDRSQGTRKLFSTEEKSMMNTRVPDVTLATSGKWHPLHTLVAAGEFYLVNSLLKHNLDINTPDKNGLTTIHRAILAKKQAIFNFLLRESANPFVRDNEGATLLHYAVFAASSQMIKILLLYNVDINLQDKDGWTPLHLAVQSRRTDILRLLLIKGADKTLKNKDGFTALDLCLYSGRDARTYELIKLLKRIY